MDFVSRLIRGDAARRTRFHTVRGEACFDVAAIVAAGFSTLSRIALGRYEALPWLVREATKEIEASLTGADLFEFGSGKSTRWYAARANRVISVEANSEWFYRIRGEIGSVKNCELVLREDPAEYVSEVEKHLEMYDVIVVDGEEREACLRSAVPRLRVGGILVLDNTDVQPVLIDIARELGHFKVQRFTGYAPGIFHANETSILTRIA